MKPRAWLVPPAGLALAALVTACPSPEVSPEVTGSATLTFDADGTVHIVGKVDLTLTATADEHCALEGFTLSGLSTQFTSLDAPTIDGLTLDDTWPIVAHGDAPAVATIHFKATSHVALATVSDGCPLTATLTTDVALVTDDGPIDGNSSFDTMALCAQCDGAALANTGFGAISAPPTWDVAIPDGTIDDFESVVEAPGGAVWIAGARPDASIIVGLNASGVFSVASVSGVNPRLAPTPDGKGVIVATQASDGSILTLERRDGTSSVWKHWFAGGPPFQPAVAVSGGVVLTSVRGDEGLTIDGEIVAPASDRYLVSFDAETGALDKFVAGTTVDALAAAPDGAFAMSGSTESESFIGVLEPDLSLRWTSDVNDPTMIAFASAPDGSLYARGSEVLTRFTSTGVRQWVVDLGVGAGLPSAATFADGSVVTTASGQLIRLSVEGVEISRSALPPKAVPWCFGDLDALVADGDDGPVFAMGSMVANTGIAGAEIGQLTE